MMTNDEINAAIARRLGWRELDHRNWVSPDGIVARHHPRWSTSLDAAASLPLDKSWRAFGVVKYRSFDWKAYVYELPIDEHGNPTGDEKYYEATADTEPRARCLAWLKAMGEEVPDA